MSESSVQQASFGPDGTLLFNTPCRRCGYDLRGLRESGNCPECGTPVGRSVMGDLLRFADPVWLRKISGGLSILLWLILLQILAWCLTSGVSSGTRGTGAGNALATVVSLLLSALSLVAIWKITTPDPSGLGEESQFNARNIVRFVICASVAVSVTVILINLISSDPVLRIVVALLGWINSLLIAVFEWYKYKLYEYLAGRVPDLTLVSRARKIRWMGVVFLVCGLCAGAIALIAVRSPAPGAMPTMAGGFFAILAFGVFAGLGFLIYAVVSIFYLFRLRKVINEQLQLAELVWSTAPLARTFAPPPPPPVASTSGE